MWHRPLVDDDPFNLEVVADLLSADATQIEKWRGCRSMGGAEQSSN